MGRLLHIGRILAVSAVLLACVPAGGADWPMLGRDVARSGSTPEEIRGPLSRRWYRSFQEEGLSCGLQPVVAGGMVYVGTMHGTMHAIDVRSGKDRWTFRAGGGILHSAAIADGACYFAALDGKLYALDAATGRQRWAFQTGRALWNAPLTAGGKVYFGGRDGFFHALRADGTLAWRTPVGGPILCSPAFNDGRIYVAGEDMVAYCLDAEGGKVLWTAALQGISCRAYHPVVAGDVVIFTTQPGLGKFGPVDVLLEVCEQLGLQPRRRIGADPRGPEETKEQIAAKDAHNRPLLTDPNILARQLEGVREIHRRKPHTRTFFAFDKRTGTEPWIAPVCWEESCGGPGNPPVVLADGRVIVKYALFTQARHNDYARYIRAGLLDLRTGDIAPLLDPMDRAKGPPWGLVHDEMSRLTGCGGVLLHARMGYPGYRGVVGMDLKTLQTEVLADNIHYGDESIGPMNLLRLIRGEPIPPALEYLTRGAGVFGGTGTYAAVAIADGTIYYIPGHEGRSNAMLIAWGTGPGGEPLIRRDATDKAIRDDSYRSAENVALIRRQPVDWDMLIKPYGRCWPRDGTIIPPYMPEELAELGKKARDYAAAIPREALEKYIWDVPRIDCEKTPAELREQVRRLAEELLSQEWMPLHFPDLMFGGIYFWSDPADLYQSLAAAWPALDEPLRQRARQYVRKAYAACHPITAKTLPVTEGARRMNYAMPVADARYWESRKVGLRRLYPVWAWADASGDYELLKADWEKKIRPLIDEVPQTIEAEPMIWENHLIAGAIAYARLARRLGDAEARRRATETAVAMLRARVEAERTYTRDHFHIRLLLRTQPQRYLFMTPEIGRLVRDHARDAAQQVYQRYVEHLRPTWWLTWGPLSYDAWETSIDRPSNSWAVFCARAMLFGDDGPALQRYLDLPWCRADLYHLHKLALAARAYR